MELCQFLLRAAERLCDDETRQQIVEPLLADLQQELAESPAGVTRALTLTRGAIAFGETMLLCAVRAGVARLGTVARWLSSLSTATIVLVAGIAWVWARGAHTWQALAVLQSAGGALMLLPALAMWPVMLCARHLSSNSRTRSRLLAAGALGILFAVGWVAPWAQRHPGLAGIGPASRALGLHTLIGVAADSQAPDRIAAIQELSLRGAMLVVGVLLGAAAWIVMGLDKDQRWQVWDFTLWIAWYMASQAGAIVAPPSWIGPLSLILTAAAFLGCAAYRTAFIAWRNQPPQSLHAS
jgi:hypothetical protein